MGRRSRTGEVGEYQSEKENVDEDIFRCGSGVFAVEVDLMQPLDPEKRPKVHEPALNHIGFWVDDLECAVTWLEEQGVRFTPGGIRKGAAGHDVVFIHPKSNDAFPVGGEGVLIELVQSTGRRLKRTKVGGAITPCTDNFDRSRVLNPM